MDDSASSLASPSSPEAVIAAVAAAGTRHGTPCGDGEMVWRVWGDGPPLLLLHGGYGSWVHWIRNVGPLSAHFRVLVPDIPGLGESSSPADLRDPALIAAIVADGLEALVQPGLRIELACFSFGSVIGGHVAARMRERVRSFTLVGASGLGLRRAEGPSLEKFRRDMSRADLEALARRNLEILMLADPASVDAVAVHMQVANMLRARVKSRWISRGTALRDVLPGVTARLQAIWGELDTTAHPYLDERETLLRTFQPDLDFRVVPGAGHWVMYEAADRFNAALADMLGVEQGDACGLQR